MAIVSYVKYTRCSQDFYDTLEKKDKDTLYFVYTDINASFGKLYLGNKLISTSKKDEEFSLADVDDVFLKKPFKDGQFFVYDEVEQKWINQTIADVSKDTHVSSATVVAQAQGYKLTINETENAVAKEATFDPLISYISATSNKTDTKTSVHFVNGIVDLPIYSREVIDQKLRGVNAVIYQGIIPAGGISDIPEAAVGDTYMANSAFTLPAANSTTGSTVNVVSGDLLIANGTEDPDTGLITDPITFDVVPSGNDHDTTYSFENNSSHGINLHPDQGSNSGTFKLSAGSSGLITLTDIWTASSKTKDVAIEHATVTRTDPTKITETQSDQGSKTITSVKSVTTNATGHVTAVQLQDITVVDTNATVKEMTTSAATASNVATVTTGVELSHSGAASGAAADKKTTTFSLTSDNLAVSNSGTTVKMNYTWGTF